MRTVSLLFTAIITLLHGSFASSIPHCEGSLAWRAGVVRQQTAQLIERSQDALHITVLEFDTLLHPRTAAAFDALAEAHEKHGDPTTAIHHYRHALRIDPHHRHARERLHALAPGMR